MTERCLLIFRWLFLFLRVNFIIAYVSVRISARWPSLLLYRFQFQGSYAMSEHSFSRSFSYYSYCSSLLFIFPRDFVFACIHVVRNGSFCTFNILVVTGWLWICSCYADLRMIKQVVIMMIVSLILVFCKSSSAVAIISPHLFLPILNYSCYWHYLCYYWTVLYLCYIHILFLFSVSLKRPLFV